MLNRLALFFLLTFFVLLLGPRSQAAVPETSSALSVMAVGSLDQAAISYDSMLTDGDTQTQWEEELEDDEAHNVQGSLVMLQGPHKLLASGDLNHSGVLIEVILPPPQIIVISDVSSKKEIGPFLIRNRSSAGYPLFWRSVFFFFKI